MHKTPPRIQTSYPKTVLDVPFLDRDNARDGFVSSLAVCEDGRYGPYYDIGWTQDVCDNLSESFYSGVTVADAEKTLGRALKVGDWMRVYGGVGFPVRGVAVAGKVLWYQSEEDLDFQREVRTIVEEGFRRYRFERMLPEWSARITALPKPLVTKMARIMANRPDRIHRTVPYELFCCEQAAALYRYFPHEQAIYQWAGTDEEERLDYDIPGFLPLAHSDNTFGHSVMIARMLHSMPELVPDMHAAMADLIGCEDAGCHRKERT